MSRDIAAPPAPLIPPPQQKAGGRVVATMTLARLGLMLGLTAPLIAGLALKVQTLVGPGQVVVVVGIVTTAGAIGALIFDPVFGRISDRTTGRFGRRRPWLVAGSLGLMLGLLVIALAPNVWVLALGWLFGQIAGNAAVAAHTASLADQLPTAQRGKVGGLIGIAQQASTVGSAYAGKFLGQDMLLLFLVPGAIGLVLVLAFVLVLPDRPLPERPEPEGGLRTVLKTFWVNPRRHPDFAFAWVSRFLIVLSAWMFLTFRLLYLQHEMDMSAKEAASVMATGVLIYTVAVILAGQLAGWLSDRISRRKVFIGCLRGDLRYRYLDSRARRIGGGFLRRRGRARHRIRRLRGDRPSAGARRPAEPRRGGQGPRGVQHRHVSAANARSRAGGRVDLRGRGPELRADVDGCRGDRGGRRAGHRAGAVGPLTIFERNS
ncbi:MFS transporter [Saccharopolyspora karakumensis]|nr:MFS transporter [Saccharopolyspora karakumensis]